TKHILETSGDITNEVHIDEPPTSEQICEIVAGTDDDPELVIACGLVNVHYGPSLDLFEHLNDVISIDLSSVPEALSAFKGIMAEQSLAIAGSDAMTAALMTQCLVHFFRRLPSQGDGAIPWLMALQDARLGRVIDLVLENPGEKHTVDTLAETAVMSRSAFSAHFNDLLGRSPMSSVNHIRMQHATQMLTIENKSIDEITRNVGYSSRSHFSRAFKDHSGHSPKDFRSMYSSV
ncbi:MAG: AraC family transcriptional regulator, partial [Emcibacteraceae bacterium]|nr:AraC family transcriptional regulator [Emcibacteraceae bacterium]